jgi:hypothetical protein
MADLALAFGNVSNTSLSSDGMDRSYIGQGYPLYQRSNSGIDQKQQKIKLKKDALEFVDYAKEFQHDPKFKTEMCKSWSETGFCAYGNKCRFAHGKQEMFDKVIACKKYKQKECLSFFKNKYCCYGSRCHFKHEERKLSEIHRSYFNQLLQQLETINQQEIWNMTEEELNGQLLNKIPAKRKNSSFLDCSASSCSSGGSMLSSNLSGGSASSNARTRKYNNNLNNNHFTQESYSSQQKYSMQSYSHNNVIPMF